MKPTTIMVNEAPRCVVRPVDMKDLARFTRNAKSYLLAGTPDGKVSHREAEEGELTKWREALALHLAWGGEEENFFGIPL
jgi:hypothetical protein